MAKRLFVGGLSYNVTSAQLQEAFSAHGTIVSCNLITDKFTGQSKGFAFIEFSNDDDADKAIENLNGFEIDGRKITVNVARPMEDRGPRQFNRGGFGGGRGGGDHRGNFNSGGRGRNSNKGRDNRY